jgi:hypothetical protein
MQKPEGKRPFGRPCIDGAIILKWVVKKEGLMVRTGFKWIETG